LSPKEKKEKLISVKVKESTHQRLHRYRARMVLQSEGKTSYSMDAVIDALLNLLESADIIFKDDEP